MISSQPRQYVKYGFVCIERNISSVTTPVCTLQTDETEVFTIYSLQANSAVENQKYDFFLKEICRTGGWTVRRSQLTISTFSSFSTELVAPAPSGRGFWRKLFLLKLNWSFPPPPWLQLIFSPGDKCHPGSTCTPATAATCWRWRTWRSSSTGSSWMRLRKASSRKTSC